MNLAADSEGNYRWRVNLPVMRKSLDLLREFDGVNSFEGPTTFIRGERSKYIKDSYLETIQNYFPKARLVSVPNAGHWVHAQQPQVVVDALVELLEA